MERDGELFIQLSIYTHNGKKGSVLYRERGERLSWVSVHSGRWRREGKRKDVATSYSRSLFSLSIERAAIPLVSIKKDKASWVLLAEQQQQHRSSSSTICIIQSGKSFRKREASACIAAQHSTAHTVWRDEPKEKDVIGNYTRLGFSSSVLRILSMYRRTTNSAVDALFIENSRGINRTMK